MILVYVLIAVLVNHVIGAAVWAWCDEELHGQLLRWVHECPSQVMKFLAISAWPVLLIVRYRETH